MADQAEIHRMAWGEDAEERKRAIEKLKINFAILINKEQAWDDLHRLTQDNNGDVRMHAADTLGVCYSYIPDEYRKQAWDDLIELTHDKDNQVRSHAAVALDVCCSHIPEEYRKQTWDDLIGLTMDNNYHVRKGATHALRDCYSHILEEYRKQAWDDLQRLVQDNNDDVRWGAAISLGVCYSQIPEEYRKQAWNDLIGLTQDNNNNVRRGAVFALGVCYSQIPEEYRKQAWDDLHRLTQDNNGNVRMHAADTLGVCYSYIPEEYKKQAWDDLHRLTQDKDKDIRVAANHSSGRVSIYRASQATCDESVRKELETALIFFEKSSKESTHFNPAKFCLPFYRSFHTITFRDEDAEAEMKKYLGEAKSALEGSKSKEKLLEAVENLGNALKEAQKAREFSDVKADLNAYMRYCNRACELLETTEEKAPGASRLIRRGLPIIDEKIKGIIAEIQEKAKALCGETKNTTFRDAGIELNRIVQDFSQIRDPIGLEKSVNYMQIVLSAICAKMPEEERGEACTLLRQAKEEQYIEDKINLTNIVLGKISSQINAGKSMGKYIITNSQVQIAEGEGNVLIMDSSKKPEKESGLFDFMNKSAIAATLSGFGTFVFSEIFDIFPPNYNKHVISVVLAIIIFAIILIFTRTYYNK